MLFFKKSKKTSIQLFNSETKTKEIFKPIKEGKVGLYTCGPTVYDSVQIGNLRAYLFSDIVRRVFEYAGYSVRHVMNFTDFGHLVSDGDEGEDKMTKGLKRAGKTLTMENMYELATTYIDAYHSDREAMNMLKPHVMPRASEHVSGQIAYIETLIQKGFTYKTSDGIYFDTLQFPDYGVLGGASSEDHSRVGVNAEKKNTRDFALWKFDEKLGWDAPWGKGFPGWHIECTAMSTEYLGKTFDVHTGGVDLQSVHHNNEIAQAIAANNKPPVHYWLHNEFVTVDSKRMGKSLGNSITVKDLEAEHISPLAYRYWLLTSHYRQKINFTYDAVLAAQTALQRLRKEFIDFPAGGTVDKHYKQEFTDAVFDDFNTASAVAVMWKLLADEKVSKADKRATLIDMDKVLGLDFEHSEKYTKDDHTPIDSLPGDIKELFNAREEARKKKDFSTSDTLRDELKKAGYEVLDGPNGPVVKRL